MATSLRRKPALLTSQRVALAVGFIALGLVLSPFSVPLGPAKLSPTQHMINALVGILLGPWDAVVVGLSIALLRNGLGTGTLLAFPGSIFGGLVVGIVYHYLRRTDYAALLEPLGTVCIGATLGYFMIVPLDAPAILLGFIRAAPPAPYLGIAGMWALWASFAVSAIPGSIVGFIIVRALRRAGLTLGRMR